jgi:hypothetical protein
VVHGSRSLKDKRQVVRSVVGRLRARFNASVAEVEANDLWNRATVAVAVVTNGAAEARSLLDRVLNHVESAYPGSVADSQIDLY